MNRVTGWSAHTYWDTVVVVQFPTHSHSAAPWTAACQASLSLTISWSLPKFMSIASVMPPSHLILWRPLLLLPSIFPSSRDFSSKSALHIRWPKYWSFSFSISPSNGFSGLISLVLLLCLVAQSYPTLCSPMDCSPQAPLSRGILQARMQIFPTRGLNLDLLHCRRILYLLSLKGSP